MKQRLLHCALALGLCVSWLAISFPVFAGSGHFSRGNPSKLNLKVLFTYDEDDPDGWKPMFEQASILLYDALQTQVQLGKIEAYVNCPAMRREADVHISDQDGGAKAHVLGLGGRGQHVFMFQRHKDTSGDYHGQFGLVHELGHYVFGIYDEYKGAIRLVPYPHPYLPVHEEPLARPFFCTAATGEIASIMDGGSGMNNHRHEFCTTAGSDFATAHHRGFIYDRRLAEFDNGRATAFLTDQEMIQGRSSWEQIVRIDPRRYGLGLIEPTSEPSQDTAGHASIEWEVIHCTKAVILVIDRSISMAGERLRLAKTSAQSVVRALEDSTFLGIVSFATDATIDMELKQLDPAARVEAATAISALSAGGQTNTGAALQTALEMFRAQDPRAGTETVVLLSDGAHTTGPYPSTLVPEFVAEGIKIHSLGLGDTIDADELQSMSHQTGGEALFATEPEALPEAMVRLALDAEGSHAIQSERGELAPGASADHDIFVDGFNDSVVFALVWTGEPTDELSLTATDADGRPVDPTDPGVDLQEGEGGKVLRVDSPAVGSWQLSIQAPGGNTEVASYALLALDDTAKVHATAQAHLPGLAELEATIYPHPVAVSAVLVAEGEQVQGATATAQVLRPDGSSVSLELFDDGGQGHGDSEAGDGIYSNYFTQYSQNGAYHFNVRAHNEAGTNAPSHELGWEHQSHPIAPFVREDTVSAQVVGVPASISPGSLALAPSSNVLQDATHPGDLPYIPIVSFRLTSGPNEYVRVDKLVFRAAGTGDERRLSEAQLFVDDDKDGWVDHQGMHAQPIGRAVYSEDDGTLEFSDLLMPTLQNVDLILVYVVDPQELFPTRTRAAATHRSAPTGPWGALGLVVLGLAGVFTRRRDANLRVVGLLMLGVLIIAPSCSDSEETSGQRPAGGEAVTFSASIHRDDIEASGATTTQAIAVTGVTDIQGPVITVTQPAP